MSAIGLTALASALLLVSAGAADAAPRRDRTVAAPRTSATAAAAPGAPTAAKAPPRVLDPPVGDAVTSGGLPAPVNAQPASVARPPSLADVVERIDRILREGASTSQPRRSSVRPARDNTRKAAAPRGPSGQPAGRPDGREVTLVWPEAPLQRSTGVQVRWPADLDPRRKPGRPLGVRLSWPSGADSR